MHPRSACWTGNGALHTNLACPTCMQINIRQLCFFRVANASGHPELWWDYVQAFAANCSMAATRYNVDCAAEVCGAIWSAVLCQQAGRTLCPSLVSASLLAEVGTNRGNRRAKGFGRSSSRSNRRLSCTSTALLHTRLHLLRNGQQGLPSHRDYKVR